MGLALEGRNACVCRNNSRPRLWLFAWVPETVIVERERIVEVLSAGATPQAEPPPTAIVPATHSPVLPPQEISPPSEVVPETTAMWKVRKEVLRWGPEMLPRSSLRKRNANEANELDQWLGVPVGTFTAPYTTPHFIPKSVKED